MSENRSDGLKGQALDEDKELKYVNIGGRSVPWDKVNKPHHAVVNPKDHIPQVDASSFPDIEPEAKEREARLEAERAQKRAQ